MSEVDTLSSMALDLLPCGVALADGAGRLVAANAAARMLLGLDGRTADEVELRCEGQAVSLGHLLRDHAAGGTLRQCVELEHPGHGLLRGTLTHVDGGAGGPRVHLVVERAPRRDWRWAGRSDPLMSFAHEIRNVLTPLRETVALFGEGLGGALPEQGLRLLAGMQQDVERMARLTGDMTAVSRVRAGRIRVAARLVELAELVSDVACSFEAAAARAGVRLELAGVELGASCLADRDLLAQALANLVGNALKFTPPGGTVAVGVQREEVDGADFVAIAVRDTGPGLSAEAIERVLGRGGAAGPGRPDGRAGLGIGLAIAREIAEHHGGRLDVESEPGAGSCFRVILPTDLRRGEHWRLAQIAEGIKLARALNTPLSVVEIGLCSEAGRLARWSFDQGGLPQLPLVAPCLEESLRPSDVVMVGEDSATLVLYDVDGPGATRVANRAVAALARLLDSLPGGSALCAVRLGVASYPADGATARDVAHAARKAMWDTPARLLGAGGDEAPRQQRGAEECEAAGLAASPMPQLQQEGSSSEA